jgi:hypothetical protein
MYARVTTFQTDPARLDEVVSKIDEIKGQIKSIAGIVDSYSVWRSDGHGVTTAIYESQEAAEAASEQIQAIWGIMAEFLTATPSAEAYDNVAHLTG